MSLLALPNDFLLFLCETWGGMDTLDALCFLNLLKASMKHTLRLLTRVLHYRLLLRAISLRKRTRTCLTRTR